MNRSLLLLVPIACVTALTGSPSSEGDDLGGTVPMLDGLDEESAGKSAGNTEPACEGSLTSLVAVGDIQLGRNIFSQMVDRNDYAFPMRRVKDTLFAADIAVGNLESQIFPWCPVLTTGMRLCGGSRAVESLTHAGMDVVSVANNHSHDFGKKAFDTSVGLLKKNGIAVAGGGPRPALVERNGVRFAFLAYSPVDRRISLKRITSNIRAAKNRADVIVVLVHWGVEYSNEPDEAQIALAEFMVEQGASLIIGSHPHVLQPMVKLGDATVAYSLGNFVFDQMWSSATSRSAAGKFDFCNTELKNSKLVPVELITPGVPFFPQEPDP